MREIRLIGIGLLLITIPSQCVDGATLTPVTSCSINGVPTPCGSAFLDPAGTLFFGDDELGTDHLELTVVADAHGNMPAGNPSASAAIDLTFFATTAGPVRPGIAEFSVAASGDGNFGGIKTRTSTASIGGLGTCTIEFPVCFKQSPEGGVPFTLGLPFQIKLTAEVEYVGGETSGFNTDGSIQLSLFELVDGVLMPVNILGPVDIPEPNPFVPALLFAGAGVLWKLRGRRRPEKV